MRYVPSPRLAAAIAFAAIAFAVAAVAVCLIVPIPVTWCALAAFPLLQLVVVLELRARTCRCRLPSEHAELRDQNAYVYELAVAAERGRLARDMHDSLGQCLTAALMTVRDIRRRLAVDGSTAAREAHAETDEAEACLRTALAEVRRVVRALRPLPLENAATTVEALEVLAGAFRRADLEVGLEVNGPLDDLDPAAQTVIYRVLQESLTNIVRHSSSDAVTVVVDIGSAIVVTVSDYGVGASRRCGWFAEPPPLVVGGSSGLAGLRARAAEINGTLSASPTPHGFVVQLRAPR